MSHIGQILDIPEGYAHLEKGRYYYLGRSGTDSKVHLITFEMPAAATLATLSNSTFESALFNKLIVPADEPQNHLPPWLRRLEGRNFETLDKPKNKKTYLSRVNERLDRIRPLLEAEKEILSSPSPMAAIRKTLKQTDSKVRVDRAQLWFFTYLVFGRSKWALLPPLCNAGYWERNTDKPMKKQGRPSYKGKNFGHPMTADMAAKIYLSYDRFSGLSNPMTDIWEESLTHIFKCEWKASKTGKKKFAQPAGEPFPTFAQFRRAVIKKYGLAAVQIARFGATRVRTKLTPSVGRFSEEIANLMEKLEGDAFTPAETPIGILCNKPMRKLYVVRIRCVASGMLVGIGFSPESERASAYRMALFCMSIPKDIFCGLFGITITPEEWPCLGLPSWLTVDRGPGACVSPVEELEHRLTFQSLAPSYSGQSKATAESSHPRETKHEGRPTHLLSDMNYIDLMKREIFRVLKDNQSINVSSKEIPSMIHSDRLPIPIHAWRYLDARFRTDAHPVPFAVAVRNFLSSKPFTIREDGVFLHGQRFNSEELKKTDIFDRYMQSGSNTVNGYFIDLIMRQVWIDYGGMLIQVRPIFSIRNHESQYFFSLEDIENVDVIRALAKVEMHEHRAAVAQEYKKKFEDNTGKKWGAAKRKNGRANKNTKEANDEMVDVRKFAGGNS